MYNTYIFMLDSSSSQTFHLATSSHVQDAEKYKLGHPSQFHYLNQSKTYELDGVNSAEEYMTTRRAMDIVGISHEEQVFKISLALAIFKFIHCIQDVLFGIFTAVLTLSGNHFSDLGSHSTFGKH